MSRISGLVKNTFVLSIGTFLPKLASFITLPILTGYLTQKEYGTFDLITVLVSLVLPIVTLQIQTAAFRFLIDYREDKKSQKSIITNIYVFTIPVAIIALIILLFCLRGISSSIRFFICIYLFADILVSSTGQIIRGLSDNMTYSLSAIISAIGKMIFAVICVWKLSMGLMGAVLSLIFSEIFAFIFLFIKSRIRKYIDFRLVSKKVIIDMLKYSWPMVPNSMSMWIMRVSDRIVVTAFLGLKANAIYAVANKIPQLLTLGQTTFTMAWQESASLSINDKDSEAYYTYMFKIMFRIMSGFMCLLISFTPILFRILIRGAYNKSFAQMPILFLAMFFFSMSSYLGGIYVAHMATKNVGITTAIAAVVNLVVDLALVNTIGIYAASISTLVSYIFLFLYRLIDVRRLSKLKYNFFEMIILLLFMIITCVIVSQRNFVCDIINIVLSIVFFIIVNFKTIKIILQKINGKRKNY